MSNNFYTNGILKSRANRKQCEDDRCELKITCLYVYSIVLKFKRYLFLKKINLFILFLAALGLHCCVWAFSSCGEWGLLFVVVCGLLIAVTFLVVEHGL